jgi:hypothetical protein
VKVYIAGPMTGIPQFNFPAFDAAAAALRERGLVVQSPAEMDDEEDRANAMASEDGHYLGGTSRGKTWGDFLSRDVKMLADEDVSEIYVLPGWERSKGARFETVAGALIMGMPIRRLDGTRIGPVQLLMAWTGLTRSKLIALVTHTKARR